MKRARSDSFSLIELTLALGVAAFCLIAVFGLIPIGMSAHRAGVGQTIAGQIGAALYADMRTGSPSPQFGITDGQPQTLYFDSVGNITADADKKAYRVTITFPGYSASSRAATNAHLLLTWPGEADPQVAAGSHQLWTAFGRN